MKGLTDRGGRLTAIAGLVLLSVLSLATPVLVPVTAHAYPGDGSVAFTSRTSLPPLIDAPVSMLLAAGDALASLGSRLIPGGSNQQADTAEQIPILSRWWCALTRMLGSGCMDDFVIIRALVPGEAGPGDNLQGEAPTSSDRPALEGDTPRDKPEEALLEESSQTPADVLQTKNTQHPAAFVTHVHNTYPIIPEIVRETIRFGSPTNNDGNDGDGISQSLFDAQVDGILASIESLGTGITGDIAAEVSTRLLTVTGNGSLTGSLAADGAVFGSHFLATGLSASSTLAGSLSIGTTTSSERLTLDGAAYLAAVAAPGDTASRLYNLAGDLYWAGNVIGGATTGTWTTDGTHVWRASGHVGVGTTTPPSQLSVQSSSYVANQPYIAAYNSSGQREAALTTGANDNTYGGSVWLGNSTGNVQLQYNAAYPQITTSGDTFSVSGSGHLSRFTSAYSDFAVGGTTYLTLGSAGNSYFNNGNVGIGEAAPSSKLSVSGGATIGASYDTTAAPTNGLIIEGNVGIGTTSPLAKLDIYGTAGSNPAFRVSSSTNASIFQVNANGNVGIGTEAPNGAGVRRLEIAGIGGSANDYGSLTLSNAGAGGNNYAGSLDYYAGGTLFASIRTALTSGGSTGHSEIRFFNRNGASVSQTASINKDGQFSSKSVLVGGGAFGALHEGVILRSNNTGAGANEQISFQDYASNNISAIRNIYPGGTQIGSLAFLTANGGALAEVMRITSTGNVGIGTTNPQYKLDMGNGTGNKLGVFTSGSYFMGFGVGANSFDTIIPTGATDSLAHFSIKTGDSSGTTLLRVNNSGNVGIGTASPGQKLTVSGGNLSVTGADDYNGYIEIKGLAGSHWLRLISNSYVQHIRTASNNGLSFETSNNSTSRLFISAAGNVGIGTTSPTYRLDVLAAGTDIARFHGSSGTGCTLSDGGVVACSSDERLKTDIADLGFGLDELLHLRPVSYHWKEQAPDTSLSLGFIAQEVEPVFPSLVRDDEAGTKSLNQIGLIPVIVSAVQELHAKITAFAERIVSSEIVVDNLAATTTKTIRLDVVEAFCLGTTCISEDELRDLLDRKADGVQSLGGPSHDDGKTASSTEPTGSQTKETVDQADSTSNAQPHGNLMTGVSAGAETERVSDETTTDPAVLPSTDGELDAAGP